MRNLEAKFKIPSYDTYWDAAKHLTGLPIQYLRQVDRYYQPPPERVILRATRIIDPVPDFYYEQICYQRRIKDNLQISEYHRAKASNTTNISPTSFVENKPNITVAKYREVFILEQFRIHLDFVDHLGCFIEIIRRLQDGEDEESARSDYWDIVQKINLSPSNIIDESYIDLLSQRN